MAFTGQSGLLKFGFILSVLLFILGLVCVGTLVKNIRASFVGYSVCFLFNTSDGYSAYKTGPCNFAIADSALITIAGAVFFGLDWITWKKSENYKGKRASLAALIISSVMCVLSFCGAIVVYLGAKKTVSSSGCTNCDANPAVYTGAGCAAVSGVIFAIYGISEYAQYRRRHVNGDKW
ncbi:hypothetical protein EMPS_08064 [Entomortierella parvispora]|uniref:Uncharacterized protein n=1 Tax=Entomortierella parvispora TaxID=205924 RepID=A0A9P3HFL9_9FUNG|nr:hypothetical protein EMPS_08064 [Entomortierella parvispora]